MGKHIFVDGGLYVSKGCLYSRDVSAGGSWHPEDAEIVSPLGGVWEITSDTGSIFSSYYVREFVSCGGGEFGDIVAYADIYNFTIDQYEKGLKQIKRMLEIVPGGEQGVSPLLPATICQCFQPNGTISFVHFCETNM